VAILAGGLGTRLSEETHRVPKPMVEIGGRPILWHIMKGFAARGFGHFVVAVGYKSDVIKRFFVDYRLLTADVTVDTGEGRIDWHGQLEDAWRVELIETGLETNTGGRVARLGKVLTSDLFFLTYGDGVSDVDPRRLLDYHRAHGRLATVTAIRPPSRFGGLVLDGDRVECFTEKSQLGEGWINGGFMVLDRSVIDRVESDDVSFEADVLEALANDGELMAYRHDGFWHAMDTLRDVRVLNEMWDDDQARWRTW